LSNVFLGVSVENQATADERIPHLLATPAAVRFVSYEPALGPVSFFENGGDGRLVGPAVRHAGGKCGWLHPG
jgi:protein gp37